MIEQIYDSANVNYNRLRQIKETATKILINFTIFPFKYLVIYFTIPIGFGKNSLNLLLTLNPSDIQKFHLVVVATKNTEVFMGMKVPI